MKAVIKKTDGTEVTLEHVFYFKDNNVAIELMEMFIGNNSAGSKVTTFRKDEIQNITLDGSYIKIK